MKMNNEDLPTKLRSVPAGCQMHRDLIDQAADELDELRKLTVNADAYVMDSSWEDAPRTQLLDALRFQGCTTNELLRSERERVGRLIAAEARVAELEMLLKASRAGVPLGPVIGACTIVEQEAANKALQVRVAELEGDIDSATDMAQQMMTGSEVTTAKGAVIAVARAMERSDRKVAELDTEILRIFEREAVAIEALCAVTETSAESIRATIASRVKSRSEGARHSRNPEREDSKSRAPDVPEREDVGLSPIRVHEGVGDD